MELIFTFNLKRLLELQCKCVDSDDFKIKGENKTKKKRIEC